MPMPPPLPPCAVAAREQADRELRSAPAALDNFSPSKKKQKSSSSTEGSNPDCNDGTIDINEPQPPWKDWVLSRFRKHESELERRRAVDIDDTDNDESIPRPGANGWRHHPRRGLIGGIKDWAEGSTHKVAFMLAELVDEFGVQDEVCRCCCVPSQSRAVANPPTKQPTNPPQIDQPTNLPTYQPTNLPPPAPLPW